MFQQTLFQGKEKESNQQIPDDIQLKVVSLMAQMIITTITSIMSDEGEIDDTKPENN